MDIAIEIRNLKKKFGSRKALDGITLDIRQGECFGVLGPNGAGKTTLLSILSGAVKLEDGELFILGLPIQTSPREIKSRIGVVPQAEGLETDLSVRENLKIFASYFGLSGPQTENHIQDLLRSVSLDDRADEIVENLSGGLKRRLAIVRALLNDPEILVLDEPTVALDPSARYWVWDFLRERKRQNVTLVLTTHYMEEAEALCDRIGLMHKGKLLDMGTPKDVIERHWGKEIVDFIAHDKDGSFYYANRLKQENFAYQMMGQRFLIAVKEGQTGQEILALLRGAKVTLRKPDLNDVFMKLTGSELGEGENDDLT